MHVQRYSSAQAFYDAAVDYLIGHEAIHNLLFGLTTAQIASPSPNLNVYWALVWEGEQIVGGAIRFPANKLLLARMAQLNAIAVLIEDMMIDLTDTPGVMGLPFDSRTAAAYWAVRTLTRVQPGMPQRIYQLEQVRPPQGVAGNPRWAAEADRALMTDWMFGFQQDSFGHATREQAERTASSRMDAPQAGMMIWEADGMPVSCAAYSGYTPNGVRIGPVYTPPQQRRKGYGAAVTAALSQYLLDQGRRAVYLFTDLRNETSNHIYQTIGYQAVTDVGEWWFSNG
jgi:uncharacterized protein